MAPFSKFCSKNPQGCHASVNDDSFPIQDVNFYNSLAVFMALNVV